MWTAIGMMIAAIIAGVVTTVTTATTNAYNSAAVDATNKTNAANVEQTNETNLQISRETNAANAEQANLAYERSLPVNQVFDMMQAGMSKPAALSKLAGGGSYVPSNSVGATMQPYEQMPFQKQNPAGDLSSIIRSLGDIPQNAMQQQSIETNLEKTRLEIQNARNEEIRRQQLHDMEIDEKLYTKWERESMDSLMSLMENRAQELNIQPNENQSMHEYIRALGLQNESSYKSLPASARQRAFDHFKQAQQEKRDQMEANRRESAASDAHALSLLEQKLKSVDVRYYNKEKHEQLLNLMRVGQGLIQENNIKFQDYTAKEMENFVREAGINNEREARALAAYINKLSNDDELDVAEKGYNYPRFMKQGRAGWRLFLRDFGEILSKVKFGG